MDTHDWNSSSSSQLAHRKINCLKHLNNLQTRHLRLRSYSLWYFNFASLLRVPQMDLWKKNIMRSPGRCLTHLQNRGLCFCLIKSQNLPHPTLSSTSLLWPLCPFLTSSVGNLCRKFSCCFFRLSHVQSNINIVFSPSTTPAKHDLEVMFAICRTDVGAPGIWFSLSFFFFSFGKTDHSN